MSKLKIYLTHATCFDFKNNLYIPILASRLPINYELILPHLETNDAINSKAIINAVDLVIAEVSYPSTGQGIELGWAETFNKPIICIYEVGKNYSTSLQLLTNKFISYRNDEELVTVVAKFLAEYSDEILASKL